MKPATLRKDVVAGLTAAAVVLPKSMAYATVAGLPVTVGLYTMLNRGNTTPALYTSVIIGALVSILPLVALFLTLQRYWRVDLFSGAVKQ